LEERLATPPGESVEAHQAGVCLFLAGFFGYRPDERFDGRPELLALLVEPGQLHKQREIGPS
jgi:hypothetical protein